MVSLLPVDGNHLAAAGEIACAGGEGDVAVVAVIHGGVVGLEHQHVGGGDLGAVVAVNEGAVVLLHQVDLFVLVVLEDGVFVVGVGDGDGVGRLSILGSAVFGEAHLVLIPLRVGAQQAVGGELFHHGFPVGHEGVLPGVGHSRCTVRVPEEDARGVGALHAVHVVDPQLGDGVVDVVAASGVDEHPVMAQGQVQEAVPGRAHRADGGEVGGVLIHGQHPGDAALGNGLIDDVGGGVALLGHGHLDVVHHHGDGLLPAEIGIGGLSGERIGVQGRGGGGLHRGRGVGRGGRSGGARACAQGEEHGAGCEKTSELFHGNPP